MDRHRITIAIDGHASAGKSTMARALATELGCVYVDTGAMYRAAALFAMRERAIGPEGLDAEKLVAALDRLFIQFKYNSRTGRQETYLSGMNVEKEIRSAEVSRWVSPVATVPALRAKLVHLQRRMASMGGVVMDGRDIGTVVLPKADLKFFVTASPEVRAQRRLDELRAAGRDDTFESILANVVERDRIDSTREVAPLVQAPDAIVLDNSHLTLDEQFEFLLAHARRLTHPT
jgi:cytidylate kinase